MIKILITGGGTGGHIFPAIAIADAIRVIRPEAEIMFVGAEGKMEMERVPQAGYPISGLPVAGFHRRFTWGNLLNNMSFPFRLIKSGWQAYQIVKKFQPHLVIGTGGYASGPVMRMAQRAGIPTIIQEQNSYAGVTNKLLAARATKICVAYEGMEKFFPAGKILLTGNPVRADILHLENKRNEALRYFALQHGKKNIVVLGGSLGARTLNQTLRDNSAFFDAHPDYQLLWQCGKLYFEEYENCSTARLKNVRIVAFLDRMEYAYALADVIVSRAGALSISELCLVGKPAVLVPSPNVAEDHQTKNALALSQKNAARLVADADANPGMLEEVELILKNPTLAVALSENIQQLARPDAAHKIACEAINVIENYRRRDERNTGI